MQTTSEEDLSNGFNDIVSLLESMRKEDCKIYLRNQFDQNKSRHISLSEFKEEYEFSRLNETHLNATQIRGTSIINSKFVNNNKYFITINSVLTCLMPAMTKELIYRKLVQDLTASIKDKNILNSDLTHRVFNEADSETGQIKNNNLNNSNNQSMMDGLNLDLLVKPEIQPVLYVSSILVLFTIIFALILLLSYHFNRQDAELTDSKLFLKRWKEPNYFEQPAKTSNDEKQIRLLDSNIFKTRDYDQYDATTDLKTNLKGSPNGTALNGKNTIKTVKFDMNTNCEMNTEFNEFDNEDNDLEEDVHGSNSSVKTV